MGEQQIGRELDVPAEFSGDAPAGGDEALEQGVGLLVDVAPGGVDVGIEILEAAMRTKAAQVTVTATGAAAAVLGAGVKKHLDNVLEAGCFTAAARVRRTTGFGLLLATARGERVVTAANEHEEAEWTAVPAHPPPPEDCPPDDPQCEDEADTDAPAP